MIIVIGSDCWINAKKSIMIGMRIMSLIRFIDSAHDSGAHFFRKFMYRSAVSNGLLGRLTILNDLYSVCWKLYLLKCPNINIDDVRVVANLDHMEDEIQTDRIANN